MFTEVFDKLIDEGISSYVDKSKEEILKAEVDDVTKLEKLIFKV